MPTLATLRQKVIDRANLKSTDTRLTTTVLNRIINDALSQVSMEHAWPWLQTSASIVTVAGTSSYAVPADYIQTHSLVQTDIGAPLVQRATLELDQIIASGRPSTYAIYGTSVLLKPIPDGAYTISHRYIKAEPALVADGDVSLIPEVYSRGAVEWAAMLAFQEIKDEVSALSAEKNYRSWLNRVSDNVRSSREPMRVRVRPGSWL